MQGTRIRGLPGSKWMWGGQVCRICPQKQITVAGHLSRSLACRASAPCLIDPAGTVSEAGPMGCVLSSFTGSMGTGGEIWQGSLFGQQPRSGPCTLFSDLSLLWCMSLLPFSTGDSARGAHVECKDGKPEVQSYCTTFPSQRALGGSSYMSTSATDLSSRSFNDLSVFSLYDLSRQGGFLTGPLGSAGVPLVPSCTAVWLQPRATPS